MAKKLEPVDSEQVKALGEAIEALKLARDKVHYAECPALIVAIRHAIKSAGGAERHAYRRLRATVACNA